MNKIALITGATSGIGYANLELLLKEKINCIAIARSLEKAGKVKEKMRPYLEDASLHFVIGDLSNKRQTLLLIDEIKTYLDQYADGRLDILMNIAGIVSSGLHLNEDGNELTFATNHLSVFMLTTALIPYLEKSIDPRILVVSSLSHYRASINFNNLQNKKMYNILKAYKRSKLYNVLFVKAFHQKYLHLPIFAIDPGLVKTEIGLKNTSRLAAWVWKLRVSKGTDAYYPAHFMVRIALDPSYVTQSGLYFKEGIAKKSNPVTYNMHVAHRLWDETMSILNK
ncbi:MAG: SDR family NAD(P)-dependent oxidoreductase [Acholeplasmataceae bacterium]|jgi:NAD(P)-dependent dehydrogenase (short-subunit alcohol dehydrogenase family)|nr:SDR family NAD(P)-dependent oxidoreductase [Acholeplasmataceae bacterium]